ncbi:hypothetical protein BpHYR1_043375 [Brachionus plicatilis]|uniref:Uncharacterized protein n=1 Tax=Brachionus plicatilis TaxID=10195 RepID=A0A3M7RIE1_BRAPC|nr:hypothetical protein BpHYR1_043375 [Brachionus plicatilis]
MLLAFLDTRRDQAYFFFHFNLYFFLLIRSKNNQKISHFCIINGKLRINLKFLINTLRDK